MKIAVFLFALLLSGTAFAAEQALPPMSQNAVTPAGNGYSFLPNNSPEGGGRWVRNAPHPAAPVDEQMDSQAEAAPAQKRNHFADPQYADPAQVTAAPPAPENADAPEVSAPQMTNRTAAPPQNYTPPPQNYTPPAQRDPNPPIASTGGGSWSLPQQELDAMAGRAPSAPQQQPVPQAQQLLPASSGMQSFSVTPIEKCLSQLPPDEAFEIRTRFVKPYEECRNRVGANARQQKTIEAGKQAEALAPETPRNYIRVAVPPEKPAAKDTSTAGAAKDGDSFINITGNSKLHINP